VLKMKIENVKIIDDTEVELLPLSDLHLGSKECDEELINKAIDYIKNNDNCYTILLGDLIENNVYDNKINAVHTQKYQVQEQVEQIVNLLKPIKDKILLSVSGNHEYRTEKFTGVDISALIAMNLDIPYQKNEYFFNLKLTSKKNKNTKRSIALFIHHGTGGSGTSGTKLNSIEKLHFRAPLSNIFFVGHHHINICSRKIIRYLNQKDQISEFIQYFIGCGSALKTSCHGYAAKGGYAPIPSDFVLVKLKLNFNDDIKCQTEIFD